MTNHETKTVSSFEQILYRNTISSIPSISTPSIGSLSYSPSLNSLSDYDDEKLIIVKKFDYINNIWKYGYRFSTVVLPPEKWIERYNFDPITGKIKLVLEPYNVIIPPPIIWFDN
jgi:hypothetical protein